MSLEKIRRYNEKIKNAELEKANLEGKLESIMCTLKNEFGVDDITQAQKKLQEMIDKKVSKLENDYDWG